MIRRLRECTLVDAQDRKLPQRRFSGSVSAAGWSIMQFILEFTVGHVMNSDMSSCQTLVASRNAAPGLA